MNIVCKINSWKCENQKVFVRADLNAPLQDKKIENDRRLQGIRPTLDLLIKKNATIVLASHIGRPKNKEPYLSTRILLPWFEQHGYNAIFCESIEQIREKEKNVPSGTILLLENLRFFPEEKECDEEFIKELRSLAQWYVNDAFGSLHRNDASLAPLAYSFPKDHRSIGCLVSKELSILNTLLHTPQQPVCVIIGGGKVKDKLPLIDHLIEVADYILLCPALVFTFSKAMGLQTGKSLVDNESLEKANAILAKAKVMGKQMIFPKDYQVADDSIDGRLSIVEAQQFPDNGIGVSIGPKTAELFEKYIKKSGTIFYNGMMGFPDQPKTLIGVKKLLTDISEAKGTSIVAGGNSIAIVDQLDLKGITFCSTGGGSTLTYLSGKKLPGLAPFD